MRLNPEWLEKVRTVGGRITARCPACAETGGDRKGEHLFVAPDGRFGCVLFPGQEGAAHRKRIWALAGDKESGAGSRQAPSHHHFVVEEMRKPATRKRSVLESVMRPFGTAGTPQGEAPSVMGGGLGHCGTVGTGASDSREYGEAVVKGMCADDPFGLPHGSPRVKDPREPVPNVPNAEEAAWSPESLDAERRFGGPHARLYPLIGHRVRTPQGGGTLKQVFTDTARVVLDVGGGRTTEFRVALVMPDPRGGGL